MPSSNVRVDSGSRLHFSLIDMHGSFSGRVDGGVGLTLSEPGTSLIAKKQEEITITSNSQIPIGTELLDDINNTVRKMQKYYDLGGVAIQIEKIIPVHSGFGSKTQTLLSAAVAYSRLYQVACDTRSLANVIGRGGTSGIGVEAFMSGGFIVDCGHPFESKNSQFKPSSASKTLTPAPLVGKYQFPDWPVLIVTPDEGKQIHGEEEQKLFNQICPIPLSDAQACSHVILMMLIPSVIEANLEIFCKGINLLQKLAWKRFEIDAQPAVVRRTMEFLQEIGIQGVGMSSWGATVFGLGSLLNDEASTERILQRVRDFLSQHGGGVSFITMANNSGANITETTM